MPFPKPGPTKESLERVPHGAVGVKSRGVLACERSRHAGGGAPGSVRKRTGHAGPPVLCAERQAVACSLASARVTLADGAPGSVRKRTRHVIGRACVERKAVACSLASARVTLAAGAPGSVRKRTGHVIGRACVERKAVACSLASARVTLAAGHREASASGPGGDSNWGIFGQRSPPRT